MRWQTSLDLGLEYTKDEIVGRTLDTTFVHEYVTHAGTWYYAVAAIDVFGNVGKAAGPVQVRVAH